ncbi:hypothetical protein NBRC10513v2_001982 [Rhodotorula toruloides]|uniref:Uncharacterized protein n=1 Tax=Rhodotorula toruloides TaxID=5286 RepID=A0A2T0A7Y8_RHOTO|nr:hypothetical protein AAT19DRAFT_15666 [Rhodotorula toruloides]
MHSFFDPAFTVLHDRVLDFLVGSWDWYRLLVPMALSHHWRQLAIKKVVQRFSQDPEVIMVQDKEKPHLYDVTTRMKAGAGYLRVRHCELPKPNSAGEFVEGPKTDPHEVFRPDEARVKRFLGAKADKDELPPSHIGHYQEYKLESFDPKTQIFFILHKLLADPATGREVDPGVDLNQFQIASSAWFRPALDGKNSAAGLQLAARPDLCPSKRAALTAKVSQEKGGRLVQSNVSCMNGWSVDLTTQRLDKPDKMAPDDKRNFFWERSDPRFPPCYFMLDAIRLPLLDLLVPPFTAKDDLANPEDEDFGLAAYLRNFYLNKESDDELLLAKVHEAEGCVR